MILLLLSGLLSGLTACAGSKALLDFTEPTATPVLHPTEVPTVTVTPTLIPIPSPTEAPTATPTPVPTELPTATPIPFPTELPPLDMSLFSSSKEIPFISIMTEGEEPIISREYYLNCEVTVGNVEEAYELRDVQAGVRVRGNSSAYYGDVEQILTKQVPYRIKFAKKQSMLGLNDGAKCKSWVLLRGDAKELIHYVRQ